MENICHNCAAICSKNVKLSENEFDILAENNLEIKFMPDETIVKQGTFANNIMVIKEGLVKKVIKTDNNKEIIVKINLPGSYLGLQTIGMEGEYPYNLVAITECTICMIRKAALKELININSAFRKFIFKYYSEDYNYTYKKLALFGAKSMLSRLIETIIYLSDEEFKKVNVYNYISRKELAELAGMSLESATKILNELKSDKLIETKGKEIVIKEKTLLQRLMKNG